MIYTKPVQKAIVIMDNYFEQTLGAYKMNKKRIILLVTIAVAAGIITGVLLFNISGQNRIHPLYGSRRADHTER